MSQAMPSSAFEIHANRRSMAVYLIIGFGFVVVSVVLIALGGVLPIVIGVIGALFFGWCTAIAIALWAGRRPLIKLDDRGVKVFRYPHLPWDNYEKVGLVDTQGEVFVTIVVRDSDAFRARMGILGRLMASANDALAPGDIFLSARILPAPARDGAGQIADAAREWCKD